MQLPFISLLVLVGIIVLSSSIRVLREYERAVVFRLGRLVGTRGPGLFLLIPFIDRMVKVSLRTLVLDVPTQDVITRDNVSVKVNAVVYFRVFEADKAIVEVENFLFATSQISQTTLRSILGSHELDELLSSRDQINRSLQEIIDRQTDPWGIKVIAVELKDVDLPPEMKRAMARQAEAERERRAKVIAAEGEFQAATRLADAANIIEGRPAALQLRFLQSFVEVAAEKTSTVVFPIPIDLIKPFLDAGERKGRA
jgi:regulator of protease activity HflC (stomatin/prohibitin superfamily)